MKLENEAGDTLFIMRDIINSLIGEEVSVLANYAISGKLEEYNGYLLRVFDGHKHWYIDVSSIQVIAATK